jgi:hypothetical protein
VNTYDVGLVTDATELEQVTRGLKVDLPACIEVAPPGVTPGGAGQSGHDQAVTVRSRTISAHLARVVNGG